MKIPLFIFGTCLSSFIYANIFRSKHKDFNLRSHCDKCNKQLRWWMLVPIVSYFLLKGRCYYCKEKLSIIYPIYELIGGLFFSYLAFYITNIKQLIIFSIIALSMLIMMADDIQNNEINSLFNYLLLLIYLLIVPFSKDRLISCLAISIIFLFLKLIYQEGIGLGDIEFIIINTYPLNLYLSFKCLLIACLLALIVSYKKRKGIAMIPFLCLAYYFLIIRVLFFFF